MHAGPSDAAVPAKAPLQQIAADANALAVTRGEEQTLPAKRRHQLVPGPPRSGGGPHRRLVDGHIGQAGQVEQQPAVAHMVAGPAMAAGADADAQPLSLRQLHRRDDVVHIPCLHDHIRVPIRQARVPHRVATGGLVAEAIATEGSVT